MTRGFFFLSLLMLTAAIGYAQSGEVFIGKKRGTLQTQLRDLKIDEYEKDHTGYKQSEDIWLYLFFDKSNICIRHYWLVYADKKELVIGDFEKLGWQKKAEDTLVKANYTCTIQGINEGKNLIFLVEQTSEPLVADKQGNAPDKPKPVNGNTKSQTSKNHSSNIGNRPAIEKEPEFQGLKILGWEVIKLKESED